MTASGLPRWRSSIQRRFICTALVMLPVLILHAIQLDPSLLLRLVVLGSAALLVSVVIRQVAPGETSRIQLSTDLLDVLIHTALLAALWPPTLPLWPALIGLIVARITERVLGGWAVNPFPPALLALGIGVAVAHVIAETSLAPPLVSLISAAQVSAAWVTAGVVLLLLRLWPARAACGFLLPVALVWASGGIPASALVVAAIVALFVVSDTRQLPATATGQFIIGLLAGLGTALLWLQGAAPVSAAFPVLLAFALAPWIEQLTLPRPPTAPTLP